MRRALSLVVAATLALTPAAARAYEPSSTHPGLTIKATLGSQLHRFLRRQLGLRLGLFSTLRLQASKMDRRRHHIVTRQMERFDPAGGYRPDKQGRLSAVGWLLAGSVLADVPGTHNRHHYYSPVLKRGLDNRLPLLSTWHSLLATLESGDNVRQLVTGAGFDLSGISALDWIRHKHNPLRVQRFHAELRASLTATSEVDRRHHLARALLALGSVLAVLQDMAVPGHVRDDFIGDATQRLGTTGLDRGSAYERWVSAAYGLVGVPEYQGRPIRFARLRDFFSNKRWTGLADLTAVSHFSQGTLPRTRQVASNTSRRSLHRALARSLRFSLPRLPGVSIACAQRGTCQARSKRGVMFAYRLDRKNRLSFFLDGDSHATTARHLVPLAIGYTRGAIDFLLRGRLVLRKRDEAIVVGNSGAPIAQGKLFVYADDAKGQRRLLTTITPQLPAARGAVLTSLRLTPPENARRLLVVVDGRDKHGQALVAAATLSLVKKKKATTLPPASKPTSDPLWKEDKSAKPASSQPASSQPASGTPASGPASAPVKSPTSAPSKASKAKTPTSKPASLPSSSAPAKQPAKASAPAKKPAKTSAPAKKPAKAKTP
ncbi:MAG: hypothetical protein KC503_46355 [Myxococcales bacterium]|nr:hypothetical protein [Myxococcales bacterium]